MLIANPARVKDRVTLAVMHPIVGSKWKGKPETHYDTQAGTYWEVMPTLSAGEVLLQRALLNKVVDKRKVVAYTEYLTLKADDVEQPKEAEPTPSRIVDYSKTWAGANPLE